MTPPSDGSSSGLPGNEAVAHMHIVAMAKAAADALDLFDRGFMDEAWVEVREVRRRTNALIQMNREAKAGDR